MLKNAGYRDNALIRRATPLVSSSRHRPYDGLGRLREAVLPAAAIYGMRYLYEGDALIGEYSPIDGSLRTRYVHGAGVDDPVVEDSAASGRRWMHADQRGSVIALSRSNGTMAGDCTDCY